MSSVNDQILASATKRNSLLSTLTETDYASSALQQSNAYLQDLQSTAAACSKNLKVLRASLDKEQKEHEAYRDSTMKRLAFKVSGKKEKFSSRAEKEEKEYLDAVQAHFRASEEFRHLETSIEDTKAKIEELKGVAAVHDNAQVELNKLYDSIFAGPTPEFPEEDGAERKVTTAKSEYDRVASDHNIESQTLDLLSESSQALRNARKQLADAHESSRMDMFGFGGAYADMAERSSLASAQTSASHASMLFGQARRLNPGHVNDIGIAQLKIAGGHVMSDIVFDNIFSDMAMHEDIKQSEVGVKACTGRLQEELSKSQERTKKLQGEVKVAQEQLQSARKELEDVRSRTFERVAGVLPEYTP